MTRSYDRSLPTRSPWTASPIRFGPEEPWPTDNPLLPSERPKEFWTGSIFGPEGQQIIRHEASGWRPTPADVALIAVAPELLDLIKDAIDLVESKTTTEIDWHAAASATLTRMRRVMDEQA